MGTINSANSYLQSVISTTLQNTGLTKATDASRIDSGSLGLNTDSRQLSPFAQMMSTLDQLQQTDPAKFKEVTQQIATNLQKAAQTAQSDGNPAAAAGLNQLASDFTASSQSGQMPSVKSLATALGGHHRHHHAHAASADSTTNSASQPLSQLLSAFQTDTAQTNTTDPISVIMNTLANAGLSASDS